MNSPFSLVGRIALITGSSQGIGRAIAQSMSDAGAEIVYHGKPTQRPDIPEGTTYIPQDLLHPDGATTLMAEALKRHPKVDTLVCNAGSNFDRKFDEMTPERWDSTIDLNLKANYFLCEAFARHLRAEGRGGTIVTVCSVNGFQPEEDQTAYDCSKGGLIMLTRTLAVNLAPFGIRVNGIAPGLIRTPLNADQVAQCAPHYEKKILLGRIGLPDDCGPTVVYLAAAASRYVTGQILVVDGGLTVGQVGRV